MPNQPWPRLLLTLKVTVESLLERQAADVWNVFGGLNRLCSALIAILGHGSKLCDEHGQPDLWPFIQGLNWLQPSLCGWVSPGADAAHLPEAVRSNKAKLWVYCHVENHTITEKLSWLLSDREHLLNYYDENAFLCQEKYAEATLACLKAVEQNQLPLLMDINPNLYVVPTKLTGFHKVHRRCASFPLTKEVLATDPQAMEMPVFDRNRATEPRDVITGLGVIHGSIPQETKWLNTPPSTPIRRCRSLPIILVHTEEPVLRQRRRTIVSKISPSVLTVDYSDRPKKPRKCRKKREAKTFMEDGGTSVRPAASGYFPRPAQGQSLASFLSSGPLTSAELDRENAHFRISEAMISAIEQVKCNRALRLIENDSDDSEECSMRRRRGRGIRQSRNSTWSNTTASEQTPSPPSSTTDGSEDETAGSDAEQLALSLLKQFEEKQLPRASELEWLVSAEDAPQELLPLPAVWPINPDDMSPTPLRGTADWAPPRPQLILTPHNPPVKKVALARQNLRCAGCGSRVAAAYACHYRYCDYLGKYFCTGCHTNQMSIIPGRVIFNWDFNRYPVATFSYKLLEQMSTDPLFRIDDLNPKLYCKVKSLERTRTFRLQLQFLKDFLLNCRFAEHLKGLLMEQPSYSLSEPDRFSLSDLCRARSGELPVALQSVVKTGLAHVATCDLCQARGFLCELCPCKAAIFPWSLGEVARCAHCGACYHKKCFKMAACRRCARIASRQQSKAISGI